MACEKQGWLSSRKKTFLLCNAILVFFSHLVYLDWDTTVKISSQEEGWGHLASD